MDEPEGGRDYPRNQEEFRAFFSTERSCILFLARLRWPEGFICPSRGSGRPRAASNDRARRRGR